MPHAPSQDVRTVRRLRRGIGLVAILLPIVVTVGHSIRSGHFVLLGTLSSAYHTGMRDVFVGSMSAIGIFLLAYRHARIDDFLSTLAGLAALSVAFFPSQSLGSEITHTQRVVGYIHFASSAAMFLIMVIFCFFVFTRCDIQLDKSALPLAKRVRNRLYVTSGWILILALAAGAAGTFFLPHDLDVKIQPMFWGESIAIWAFGFAWLVKGDLIVPSNAGEDVVPK